MAIKEILTKITTETAKKAIELAKFGLSLLQIEKLLSLSEGTIERYAKKSAAFKRDSEIAELRVQIAIEEAFIKRAMGYEVTEKQLIRVPSEEGTDEDNTILKEVRIVTKTVHPDLAAILAWLTNRDGARWTKNPAAADNKGSYEDFLKKNKTAEDEMKVNS
ncbi:MAG: hypothetical protein IAE93_02675 [Ignavibacteria bacterium]|nr:hypothetical protein [Ignavibacteria bacterium]